MREYKAIKKAICETKFSFIANAECNMFLREELNNDVLSLFVSEHEDLAFKENAQEANYAECSNEIFDTLLENIVKNMSVDTLLSYGEIYSIVREELNNEIIDILQEANDGEEE